MRKKKPRTLNKQLARMVDNCAYADVELLVGEEATPVYASKVVLAARSPVFEALLCGSFREGQPSSSSSPPLSPLPLVSSSSSVPSSTSLPPVFRHRVSIPDIEPRTMRHLLYWCYTDKLHPDFFESGLRERYLVNLHVAADRYLLGACKEFVELKLARSLTELNGNLLSIFDFAFAHAPQLASRICQPSIIIRAQSHLCGSMEDATEAQWLAMAPEHADAAALIEGIEEVDVFLAVQRRYEHHLAEATTENDGGDDHEDRKSAAEAVARQKVAGLLKGIRTSLMSAEELSDVVEPSGLFTDAQLAAAYKQAARGHSFIIPALFDTILFDDRVRHRMFMWHLAVKKKAERHQYQIYIKLEVQTDMAWVPEQVSAKGLSVSIFCNRHCFMRDVADSETLVSVPGVLRVPFSLPTGNPNSFYVQRVVIIVHVPTTAFR